MKRLVLAATVGTLAAAMAAPAMAAPKKPISGHYTATAAAPDPTNYAPGDYSVCAQNVPGSFNKHTFQVPAAGKLAVEMTGYMGDWDLMLEDAKEQELSADGNSNLGTPTTAASEQVTVKLKKKQTIYIIACNWAGSSSAEVKYTFTYAK